MKWKARGFWTPAEVTRRLTPNCLSAGDTGALRALVSLCVKLTFRVGFDSGSHYRQSIWPSVCLQTVGTQKVEFPHTATAYPMIVFETRKWQEACSRTLFMMCICLNMKGFLQTHLEERVGVHWMGCLKPDEQITPHGAEQENLGHGRLQSHPKANLKEPLKSTLWRPKSCSLSTPISVQHFPSFPS